MLLLTVYQVWSCGVNDNAALGRITTNVPDPDNEGSFLDIDELISWPRPIETLVEENFRAVRVAAGDSIGAAISDKGEFRTWGTFRVGLLFFFIPNVIDSDSGRGWRPWLFRWQG